MRLTLPRARLAAAVTLIGLTALLADRLAAQPPAPKKALTHRDYEIWRTASGMTLSRDGKYVAYTVTPVDGSDGEVIVRHLPGGKEIKVAKGGRPSGDDETPTPGPGRFAAPGRFGPPGSPQFNPDTTKVVFPLTPTKAEVEKAKADKKKADEMPQGVLAIMDLPGGEVTARIPQVKGFTIGGQGAGFLIYHKQAKVEPKVDAPPGAKAESGGKAEPEPAPPPGTKGTRPPFGKGTRPPTPGPGGAAVAPGPRPVRTFGTDLVIRDLATGSERTIPEVADYSLTKDGKSLVYTVASRKDENNGVFVVDPASGSAAVTPKAGPGRYSRLVWDEKQTKLAFFYDSASVTDPNEAPPPRPVGPAPPGSASAPRPQPQPKWHVYVWDRSAKPTTNPLGAVPVAPAGPGGGLPAVAAAGVAAKAPPASPAVEVLTPDTPGLRKGWAVTGTTLSFSADGTRVFLTTAPVREPTPPAPAAQPGQPADRDKVELDIWHYKDNYIQPMQKVRGDIERNRTYSAVVFLDTKQFRQISDENLQVSPPAEGDWGVGSDDKKYLHLTGYGPSLHDYALVNIRTAERRPLLTAYLGSVSMSPNGKYLLTFDGRDWSTVSVPDGQRVNLTASAKVKFFNEDFDSPSEPPPYGSAGWTTDGKHVLVYDRYDLWKLAADGSSAENLTKTGRPQQVRFRYLNIRTEEDDPDEERKGVDLSKPMLLAAENLHTRDTGFFRMEPGREPRVLVMGPRAHGVPSKARNADVYLLTVSSFADYPDYYATGPDFRDLNRVTDVNPRVREFNWGKAEIVHYKSVDGVPLSGVLITPEDFDPSKKYPMVVYIYERLSSTAHQFRLPTAGTSINPTFYASNGYLVFMPDIAYRVGYPGQSALKCVLPAIQSVVDKGFVDEKAIGIQGHSWGGYQIAYMITQTDRFKCAAAGAPVSDMVSAYGGVRWGTGLPRQFQYERTQSRIGGTLWDHPMRFIENSPIFMADRVNTPLLMLHNDQDDAVPWYQGIEYFLALRRLGKECYLLNYNGEFHGLRRKANQRDYTMRMFQFFEHHLKGKPAPDWMVKGVPFADRDKEKDQWKGVFAPEKK